MSRPTLLVLYETAEDNIMNNLHMSNINIFRNFYRVYLRDIPEDFSSDIFEKILINPTQLCLIDHLVPGTLIFICYRQKQIGYIGVVKNTILRNTLIELPNELSWEEFIECANQTTKSSIQFK